MKLKSNRKGQVIKKKKKRIPKVYTVYKIEIDGIIRYIGRTNNLKRRTRDHNNGILDINNNKWLYQEIRIIASHTGIIKSVQLQPMFEHKTKIEAKRREMFLILQYYFVQRDQLWQSVPQIKDF